MIKRAICPKCETFYNFNPEDRFDAYFCSCEEPPVQVKVIDNYEASDEEA